MSKKQNKNKSNHSKITDHKQEGKKFIPPFMQLPGLQTQSWLNERLPEYLWAALLITHLQRPLALSIFRNVASYGEHLLNTEKGLRITHSALSELEPIHFEKILGIICQREDAKLALRPLLLFPSIPGRSFWENALQSQPIVDDWEKLKTTITYTLDPQSQESTDCKWAILISLLYSGRMSMPWEVAEPILNYPNQGDMRIVRPSIRSAELAFSGMSKTDASWGISFWDYCMQTTKCVGFAHDDEPTDESDRAFLIEQMEKTYKVLANQFLKTNTTTFIDAKHDAVFGIGLYCLSIFRELAEGDNEHSIIGRLGLRTMMEAYINLSFLLHKDQPELWQEYRNHGAGQAKLAFLKLDELDKKPQFVDISILEQLANEDMWMEYQTINVGQWAKSDLRTISTIAGVKDVYDTFYSWTSTFSHTQWSAVRDSVLQTCFNPLHRLHRIPLIRARKQNSVLHDGSDLMLRVLNLIRATYPIAELEATDIEQSEDEDTTSPS